MRTTASRTTRTSSTATAAIRIAQIACVECWRTVRPRLAAVTQLGMWADQKEAAAEFTRVSTVYFDPPRYDAPLSFSTRRWLDNPQTNAR